VVASWFAHARAPPPEDADASPRADHGRIDRDSPDESQTGINVRVFPALLQDRREVLTATSTSRNPNVWSKRLIWSFPLKMR
jgi:hypothetical protein